MARPNSYSAMQSRRNKAAISNRPPPYAGFAGSRKRSVASSVLVFQKTGQGAAPLFDENEAARRILVEPGPRVG